LTQEEILGLVAAKHNQVNGLRVATLYYDATAQQSEQLSNMIDLESLEHMEVDDTYYDIRQLEERGFKDLRLLREPGFFKKLYFKLKWWSEDRKNRKTR
jgi:hypothetical protein